MESLSAKRVWTSRGWVDHARVYIRNGMVERVTQGEHASWDVPMLVPGMIDLHIHGAIGYSMKNPSPEGMREWLRSMAAHGVTGVLASPSTAPVEIMNKAISCCTSLMKDRASGEARLLGVHLEGPFINPVRKGAMDPKSVLDPSVQNYHRIVGENDTAIKLITLAPEMPGADELIGYLRERHVRISAGHSDATCDEMDHAIGLGVDGVTHFFNAARPIHHREPGLLTAAILSPNVICECIGDRIHLKPATIRLLIQAVGVHRVALITDAGPLTGMPDGEYEGGLIIRNGSPQKEDGTLSGGKMLLDEAVRGLIHEVGLDPWSVFCMASHTPARRLGLNTFGDIAPNYTADLTAFDEDYHILFTVVGGENTQI